MPTLADALRGYTPPTESALADPIVEHFRTLPQQLATNQQAMDNTMASMYKTDLGTGQPNPNYRPEAMNEFTQMMPMVGALTAWHGTPHKILGKFDISKVGTGEGAQAYGHGMYFAESPNVATGYKNKLGESEMLFAGKPVTEYGVTERIKTHNTNDFKDPLEQALSKVYKDAKRDAIDYPESLNDPNFMKDIVDNNLHYLSHEKSGKVLDEFIKKNGYPEFDVNGNLYKVDIPDEHIPNMLDWDKPFAKQTPEVQEALKKMGSDIKFGSNKESVADFVKLTGNLPPYFQRETGHGIYSELSKQLGGDKQASEYLNSLGIKGTRYLDQQSRGKSGTSNFVVFDPSTVKILEENSKPTRKELIQQQIDKIE